MPLWRAFVTLRKRGPVGPRPLPPPLGEMLHGAERWQAIAELSARTYARGCQLYPELLEEELGAIEQDDSLLQRAASVADDLAQRYQAAARDELQSFPELGTSAWVLLPLVRAGRSIKPAWEVLLTFGADPLARELFEAVPAERRAAAIQSYLSRAVPNFALRSRIEAVLPLADLAPTVDTVNAIQTSIERYRQQPHAEADALVETLGAHGRAHAALGEAIESARAARS